MLFEYINFLRVHDAVEKLRENKNFFGCAPSVYRKLLPQYIINEGVLS